MRYRPPAPRSLSTFILCLPSKLNAEVDIARAIPLPIRKLIVARHQQGETLTRIAIDFRIAYDSARNIWKWSPLRPKDRHRRM